MSIRILAAFAAAAVALTPAQSTPIQGAGAQTCTQFIGQLDDERLRNIDDYYLSWALGYISRLNAEREASGQAAIDLMPGDFRSRDQKAFLRKFCEDNGTKLYADATRALWNHLVALNGPAR